MVHDPVALRGKLGAVRCAVRVTQPRAARDPVIVREATTRERDRLGDHDLKLSTQARLLQEWTWRVGPEAAVQRQFNGRWLFRTWLSTGAGAVLVVVGVRGHVPGLWIAGVDACGGSIFCYIRAWLALVRFQRAASKALASKTPCSAVS